VRFFLWTSEGKKAQNERLQQNVTNACLFLIIIRDNTLTHIYITKTTATPRGGNNEITLYKLDKNETHSLRSTTNTRA
jgi:hypothetical protein